MELKDIIERVDELKIQVDAVRPLSSAVEQRIMQKFRLDWNYHSNAIEGNSLTYGETRAFLMHGVTAKGKPLKDHLDIEGHDKAIDYLEAFVKDQLPLSQKMIKELHKILLVRPYESDAVTPEGITAKRTINIGEYKRYPNHVKIRTGRIHYYASPEETPAKMSDLITWYRQNEKDLHPLIFAATLHYEFVAIHPFDDGNGRMSRILMNLVLMNKGYVPVILPNERKKDDYFPALEKADAGDLEDFIVLIGEELIRSMELYLKGAKGESIEELGDLDKKLDLLERKLKLNQKKEHIMRDKGGFDLFIDNFLKNFTNLLNEQLLKIDRLFENVDAIVKFDDRVLQYPQRRQNAIKSIVNVALQPKQRSNWHQVDIFWKELISRTPFELFLGIRLDYKKCEVQLKYQVTNTNELIRKFSYDEQFDDEKIKSVVYEVVNSIYKQIEAHI
ncbi:MAG: Fic family protein [Bacteroidota bacterium]